MNKKILIIFAIGVVAYIVYKKMKEDSEAEKSSEPEKTPEEILAEAKKATSGRSGSQPTTPTRPTTTPSKSIVNPQMATVGRGIVKTGR